MQPKFLTVDEYIASYPNDIQAQLNELRTIIKNTSPEIEEKLSWGAPTYYYHVVRSTLAFTLHQLQLNTFKKN